VSSLRSRAPEWDFRLADERVGENESASVDASRKYEGYAEADDLWGGEPDHDQGLAHRDEIRRKLLLVTPPRPVWRVIRLGAWCAALLIATFLASAPIVLFITRGPPPKPGEIPSAYQGDHPIAAIVASEPAGEPEVTGDARLVQTPPSFAAKQLEDAPAIAKPSGTLPNQVAAAGANSSARNAVEARPQALQSPSASALARHPVSGEAEIVATRSPHLVDPVAASTIPSRRVRPFEELSSRVADWVSVSDALIARRVLAEASSAAVTTAAQSLEIIDIVVERARVHQAVAVVARQPVPEMSPGLAATVDQAPPVVISSMIVSRASSNANAAPVPISWAARLAGGWLPARSLTGDAAAEAREPAPTITLEGGTVAAAGVEPRKVHAVVSADAERAETVDAARPPAAARALSATPQNSAGVIAVIENALAGAKSDPAAIVAPSSADVPRETAVHVTAVANPPASIVSSLIARLPAPGSLSVTAERHEQAREVTGLTARAAAPVEAAGGKSPSAAPVASDDRQTAAEVANASAGRRAFHATLIPMSSAGAAGVGPPPPALLASLNPAVTLEEVNDARVLRDPTIALIPRVPELDQLDGSQRPARLPRPRPTDVVVLPMPVEAAPPKRIQYPRPQQHGKIQAPTPPAAKPTGPGKSETRIRVRKQTPVAPVPGKTTAPTLPAALLPVRPPRRGDAN
jgi:hypothetical protein